MFEFTERNLQRPADPEPARLAWVQLDWHLLVGRDRRPIGVRLTVRRNGAPAPSPSLSSLLDGVLDALVSETDGEQRFPRGLVALAPLDIDADAAMAAWSAPRNVLLEVTQADLDDRGRLRQLFDIQRQRVRLALRLDRATAPPAQRLSGFPYVLTAALPLAVDPKSVSVLMLEVETQVQAEAAFAAGVHAVAGWPLTGDARREPRGLTPAHTAVFELIRLLQSDADLRDLERVFRGEPLLAYLLLTLANSAAYRRAAPVSSLGHAISLLGNQRLLKWLILLLAIAGRDQSVAPLVYAAMVRGHLMENLSTAAGRPRAQSDESFVVGVFSLLDAITGLALNDLLQGAHLADPIGEALLAGCGPHAPLLAIARGLETADEATLPLARAHLHLQAAQVNRALLQALASADDLQSLI